MILYGFRGFVTSSVRAVPRISRGQLESTSRRSSPACEDRTSRRSIVGIIQAQRRELSATFVQKGKKTRLPSGRSIQPDFRSIESQSCSYPIAVAGYSEHKRRHAGLVLHLCNLVSLTLAEDTRAAWNGTM